MNTILKQLQTVNAQIKSMEALNRNAEMQRLMNYIAGDNAYKLETGKIRILENHPGACCPLALFINEEGQVECAPIDPLAISFYEYEPTKEEDARRRETNPTLRPGLEIRGPLALVSEVSDPAHEISKAQLIAIQNLIGNDSTWWPITDYSDTELDEIFGNLELNVIFYHGVPVGIAHLDNTNLAVKIVFIGIDPEVQGKGLGREILHEVISQAIDRGAGKIFLDTVSHRDIRTRTSGGATQADAPQATAHDVYIKSGFKIVGVKMIDPANKLQLEQEGLAINQLNGPLEYRFKDLRPLRDALDASFGVSASKRQAISELCYMGSGE